MSLASLFAKTIVKASDNVFDAQKVNTQIKAPVARINEAVPFTNNDQVEYAQKVVRSLITGESPKFSNKEKSIDPDGAIYNSLDEMLVGQLPELRYARYYKVADKDVELEEADQAVVEYYKDIISAKKEARLLSETAIQTAAENVVKNIKTLPEYKRFVTARLPKKVGVEDEPITKITNRDVAEQEFLKDSIETDYVYRATDIGADREYDLRFPFPAEISTHVGGDMGQANFMAIQKIFGEDARDMVLSDAQFVTAADADGFPIKKRIIPEKSLNKFFAMRQAFTRMGWNPTELDLDKDTFDDIARTLQLNEVEEMAMLRSATSFNNVVMNKGRVNIKNPLDLKDQGWTPDEFNADPQQWVKAISDQTGFSVEEILDDPAYIDLRSEIRGSSAFVQDLINGNTINFLTDSLEGLRNAQLSLKIKDWLESYGFDSIRYTNAFEPSVPEGSGYSYVLFQPEQFKSATAVRFDPTDPRFTAAEGGFIGMVKKFFDSNQEVQQPKTRTIAKGDTLSKISKETGVSVSDLVKLNNIENPDFIRAGDTLILKEETKSQAQRQPSRREIKDVMQRGKPDRSVKTFEDNVLREEPKRSDFKQLSGIRAAAVRRTKAEPTESRSLTTKSRQRPTRERTEVPASLLTSTPVKTFVTGLFSSPVLKEDFLRIDEYKALKDLAKGAIERGRSGLSYRDYNKEAGSRIGYKMETPTEIATDPFQALKFTLGKAEIVRDGDKVVVADEFDFSGDDNISKQSFLDKVKFLADRTGQYFSDDISAYGLAHSIGEVFNPEGSGPSFRIGLGSAKDLGISDEQFTGLPTLEDYNSRYAGRIKERMAKGGKIDKKKMACNKPRRTPSHPKKSHVVKACEGGKEKIIRFGEQGAKTAGKPKAGESKRMKAKRKSFKARHARNIKRGKMSAAYWADKVKW